jgi:hypothetical protein
MNNYVDSISYPTIQILGHLPPGRIPPFCRCDFWLVISCIDFMFANGNILVLFIYGCYFDFHKFAREFLCI